MENHKNNRGKNGFKSPDMHAYAKALLWVLLGRSRIRYKAHTGLPRTQEHSKKAIQQRTQTALKGCGSEVFKTDLGGKAAEPSNKRVSRNSVGLANAWSLGEGHLVKFSRH